VFDLPIALAARAAKRGPRWTFAAGLVAAVHLQWATAAAGDGSAAQASSFSAAPGVGLEAIARTRLPGGLGGELRLDAEVGVPSTRYWVRGVPTLDVGSRVGVAVGIVLPSP
jgi:hypothetical protein